MMKKQMTTGCVLLFLTLTLQTQIAETQPLERNLLPMTDRIAGMLIASAIADAMAGPYEGRKTVVSQKYLDNGGWINSFVDYSPRYQHHWNVYQRHAPAGTVTDDTRMRLLVIDAMKAYRGFYVQTPITRMFLANYLLDRYQKARRQLKRMCPNDKKIIRHEAINEKFLELWFLWELCKTATSVTLPKQKPLLSPFVHRIAEQEYTDTPWHLERTQPQVINENIKGSYHHNTYARGEEMPLGLIALLPLAVYFPGNPKAAFVHIKDVDFFDIKEAPLYPALFAAVLADLFGATPWPDIRDTMLRTGVAAYVGQNETSRFRHLSEILERAFAMSQNYSDAVQQNKRDQQIAFIKELHAAFAVGEEMMCTVDEMLAVSLAIMDVAHKNVRLVIEMGVNYGRDNDTVASLAASLAGAANGVGNIPAEWRERVESVNHFEPLRTRALRLARLAQDK